MKIAFLWNGCANPNAQRNDGLAAAMLELEHRGHRAKYLEPDDWQSIREFTPDVILHHAALTEDMCDYVMEYPYKKALCFGGGPIEERNVRDYDLYFIESKINEHEFTALKKRWMRAFGIDEKMFSPRSSKLIYDGCFAGTFARWKRPELFAEALGKNGVAVGKFQEAEKECYEVCQKAGVKTIPETTREAVADIISQSYTVVNTASFWGGGQRLTLEAMACEVPPIVMGDSPKNAEYVEESGFGLVVNPDARSIRDAIQNIKEDPMTGGREYILSKYTSKHYADALEEGLKSL